MGQFSVKITPLPGSLPGANQQRFDPKDAEIWLDGSSLLAGLKVLFGSDPKEDYAGNVAKVSLA